MGTLQKRPITFDCTWCYRTITEERAPGPTPQYCTTCRDEALRLSNTARVRKHRERQAEQNPPRRGPGRPRKS